MNLMFIENEKQRNNICKNKKIKEMSGIYEQ